MTEIKKKERKKERERERERERESERERERERERNLISKRRRWLFLVSAEERTPIACERWRTHMKNERRVRRITE
jgi:hypothetical protein